MKSFVIKRAEQLEGVAAGIFALSALGAIILFFFGFIPVCPPDEPLGCYESDEGPYNFPLFAGIAFAEFLFAWLLTSFAQAFAAGLRLRVAESSLPDEPETIVEEEPRKAENKNQDSGLPMKEESGLKALTPAQQRQWLMAGQPELNTWREGSFEDWIRKQV